VSIQTLVAVGGRVVCRSEVHSRPAHDTATDSYQRLYNFSPDDEHDELETCRELKI